MGNSFARNPLMANFCAKTMTYRGLGSGIPRVLADDSHVEFVDSKEGNQFTARIFRPIIEDENGSVAVWENRENPTINPSSGDKVTDKLPINPSSGDKLASIFAYVEKYPHATSDNVAKFMGFSQESAKKYLQQLVSLGKIIAEGANRNRTYSAK